MAVTKFLLCKNIVYPLVASCIFLLYSCGVVPKNYPANKPFVFDYTVKVEGLDTGTAYITDLESRLAKQLDDSIKVRTTRKFFSRGWFFRPVLNKPPVYNIENVEKSKIYMRALLTSLGYFKDSITDYIKIDTVKDEYRTTVNFIVKPGKQVMIDSLAYNLSKPELQQLALANKDTVFVKKGGPFAKANISAELDRLTELYRNNGYLRFGREDLYGLWDTLDVSLLRPGLDPIEQLELLEKLRQRRLKPTANLEFRLKAPADSLKFSKYYIGNIIIYPDKEVMDTRDTTGMAVGNGIIVKSFHGMFKEKIFSNNLYLRKGDLYDQRNFYKTVSRLNALGSWRLINVTPELKPGSDTADFTIRMTPDKKLSFTANLEASSNNNALSGNFAGFGINFNIQNKNYARRANLANYYLRFGIETGKDTATNIKFLQTFQLNGGHNITFPRPVLFPKKLINNAEERNSFRSTIGISGALTNRRLLYTYNTANLSFGWDFQKNKKGVLSYSIKPFNIEYSDFSPQQKLLDLFLINPSLRRIFTDGLISSVLYSRKKIIDKKKTVHVIRWSGETGGWLPGLVKKNKFLDTNLYRFAKIDFEYIRKFNFATTALAVRFFAGLGYEFNSTKNEDLKFNLPFIRQYFAGGPNSMRAWALRKLGPGSLVENFTGADRYGDFQLESNIEYRFKAFKVGGVPVNGAVFTDIGNVWFIKDVPDSLGGRPDEAIFKFNKIGKDIAIGVGVGARVDFSFLVIRLDISHKVKDPSPSLDNILLQNKIFGYVEKKFWGGTQIQLGISYPFIL
jgi:outer membrane protein insertion porin family